jgi:radical SAM-linked protein
MAKIQYQFKRTTPLRFLSHLDQQRLFQRAFRRADIPVEYSQGFNPHPKMSFALAMSVGLTSDSEYGEVIVSKDFDMMEFVERMNRVLPDGLEILRAWSCPDGTDSLSSLLDKSAYRIKIRLVPDTDIAAVNNAIAALLNLEVVNLQKRNKKGKFVEKNIRPFIESIQVKETNETDTVDIVMLLNYIEQQCVKPEHILESLNNQGRAVFRLDPTIEIHREKLHIKGEF